jgi:valyl-tRNA synthetase
MLRLFAPFLPFVTEEVWSWWQEGSVHRAAWPTAAEIQAGPEVPTGALAAVGEVLSLVRKAKSEAKVSMRADVSRVVVTANAEVLARVQGGVEDLRAAGRIAELELVASEGPGDAVAVDVELAPEPTA